MGDRSTAEDTSLMITTDTPGPDTTVGRRSDVVRRLMDRGVSPRTLCLLLPEFEDTIAQVAAVR